MFSVAVPDVVAMENGTTAITRGISLHVLSRPAKIEDVKFGLDKDKLPPDDPGRTAYGQRLMQSYIDHMANFAAIFGSNAPSLFCISYWREGARQVPRVYFGDNGLAPCDAAEKACWTMINQAEGAHILPRTLATLDDCTAEIRAFVTALDTPPQAPPLPVQAAPPSFGDFPLSDDLEAAVEALEDRVHALIMTRKVPYQNLAQIWAGMLYGLMLNYPPERTDIQRWIMSQEYTLGTVASYGAQLGAYYKQAVAFAPGMDPPPGAGR